MENQLQPPPNPGSWPLVGNLPKLLTGGMDWVDAQGDALGDLFSLDIGPQTVVLLSHPDHARHVLRTHAKNYAKQGTFWSSIRSLIGLGLPTSEGDLWKTRRRMMNPQFRKDRIQRLGEVMAQAIQEQLDTWPTGDAPIKVAHLVNQVTMEVIVRTMFGTGMTPEQSAVVSEAMSFSLDHMLQKVLTDALPGWIPVPGRRAHREAVARIDAVLYTLLAERREQPAGTDLLSMFLLMREEGNGRGLTDEELRDETMSIFVAGYETTATAVSWAIDRMARDPDFAARLAEEADRVLGGRPPGPADVHKLAYTERVFKETLRLQGPIYFLAREAIEDDVIDGHRIKAGTLVSLMLNRIHRNPAVWENPDAFDPDRFLPERLSEQHDCAFVPFGAGQRQCIGKGFAIMEGVLLLASVAQRFRFTPLADQETAPQYAITYRPRAGMPLHVQRA